MTDHAVNEWTREDLPSEDHLLTVFRAGDPAKASTYERGGIIAVLDAVLDHLRINPGPSAREERVAVGDLRRLRRAHEIVEGERDQARDSLRSLRGAHSRLTRDYRHLSDRAEAAESSTAPAVTKADIEKALRKAFTEDLGLARTTDAVWSLVSGADPAVFVVRESDIAAVEVAHDERGWHARGATWSHEPTADGVRDGAMRHLRDVAQYEALARAIEAEQATDPLLDKAQEFAALADWELTDREAGLLHTVARHVLGQEAKR